MLGYVLWWQGGTLSKEEVLHGFRYKLLSFLLPRHETILVEDHLHTLFPEFPGLGGDLFKDPLSQFTGPGWFVQRGEFPLELGALDGARSGVWFWRVGHLTHRNMGTMSIRVGSGRRVFATMGVLGGTFLAAIETTVVAAAMPTVAEQLGGLEYYSWVFSAYLLASTVTIPLWGKLSDLYGRRRLYLWSLGVFLVGSSLSGAAQTMSQLILFRAVQGGGAGGLVPLGMSTLADLYRLEERGRVQGWQSAVWGVASVVGPLVGGYITTLLSWRWVFFLNIPCGLLTAVVLAFALRDAEPGARRPVDYAGAALLMIGATLFLLALSRTGLNHAAGGGVWVPFLYLATVVIAVMLLRVERRAMEPVVPLHLLSDRMVASVAVTGLLAGVGVFSAISYVPLFVQEGLGGTPVEAGGALTPRILGWVLTSVVTGGLTLRLGYRPLVLMGFACVMVSFAGLTQVEDMSDVGQLQLLLVLMGMGMGLSVLSLVLAMQNSVPRRHLGVATSFGQFTRSMGGAIGVAVLGAVIAGTRSSGGAATQAETVEAIHRAFWCAALASGGALFAGLRIPPGRANDLVHADHASDGRMMSTDSPRK